MRRHFDPMFWTWRHYMAVSVFLLLINALGPKGLVPWALLSNEQGRIAKESDQARDEILKLREDIQRFAASELVQQRMIREDLGYLQSHELSVEFLAPVQKR